MLSRAVALDWSLQQMEEGEKEAGSLPVGRYKESRGEGCPQVGYPMIPFFLIESLVPNFWLRRSDSLA